MANIRRLSRRRSLIASGGRLLIAGLGLIATPIFTRAMSPESYGILALAIAASAASAKIPSQWLIGAITRFGPASREADTMYLTRIGILFCVPPSLVMCGLMAFASRAPGFDVALLTCIYALTEMLFYVVWATRRAHLRIEQYVVGGVARNMCSVLLVLGWYLADARIGITGVFGALIIADVIALATLRFDLVVRARGSGPARPQIRWWFDYGWPLIPNLAFTVAFAYVDRFLIGHYMSPVDIGRFSAPYDVLSGGISVTVGLIGLTTVPRIFGATDRGVVAALLRRLRRNVMLVTCLMVGFTIVAWPLLSKVLIGNGVRTEDEPWLAPVLALSFGLLAYRTQYVNVALQVAHRTKAQAMGTALGVVVNIVLDMTLIPRFGVTGAAVGTLAGVLTILAATGPAPSVGRSEGSHRAGRRRSLCHFLYPNSRKSSR